MNARVFVYQRDHINTDEVIPARYLNTDKEAELAPHALEDLDPGFVSRVKPGDFIVAGEDFGCGSSREHAVWALRGARVGGVIAASFARIFFRNSINNGFTVLECPEAAGSLKTGDQVGIDLEAGTITRASDNLTLRFVPLSDFALSMIKEGGLLQMVRKKLAPA